MTLFPVLDDVGVDVLCGELAGAEAANQRIGRRVVGRQDRAPGRKSEKCLKFR